MTMDEINKMIAKYESKWGKLGHTNIMNPELNHSGINDNTKKGENKTMSRMNNDLIAFRQKVAAGKEKNRLVHRSTIDVNSLNDMNYEQLMKSHTLIHAQNPLYGQQNPNAKYYKREGEPGKYRYYYTKEEYDAAHKQGSAQTEANREAQERQQYENNKKAANNNGPSKFNNMRADVVNEYAKIAREASSKDAAKAFYDMAKGGNEAIDELYSTIQDGFKSGKLSYKDGRFETDDDQLREDIESFSDNIQKFAKQIGEASGKGREIQDELEKLMLPDIEAMSNKNKYSSKISENKDADDDQKVKEMIRNKADAKSVAKELVKSEKATKYLQGLIKEAQAGNYDFSRRDIDDVYDRDSMDKDTKRGLLDLRDAIEDYITDELKDLAKAQGKEYKKEFKDNIKDAYYDELLNRFEEMFEVAKKNNPKLGRISKLKEGADKSEAKHSTSGKALITNSAMGDELMDEYSAFQAKVKAGKERNRLAHSTTISPAELNSRYEKELESQGILVHGGNYKYYNKLDMPNGTTRYFYTKEEWDAYNQPKKTTTTLVADKKPHNGGSLEATKKYHQEKAKEAKEAPYRNAAKTAGKELNMNRALDKAWDSAEDSIKDEVKSRTKAMEDLADKYDVNHPFAKNFNNKLEEIKNNWNKKINDEANKIEEKYGKEDIWQNEEAQKFAKDVYSKGFKELEDAINAELDKQEASYKALTDAGKAWQKFDIAWDEIKELSKYDKQVLAEEMGLDSFDDEDILKKYYIIEDDKAWREAHANDEDYGKAEFEKTAEGLTNFWNDYKAAKKSLGHSAMDDDESLSHAGNYKYYNKIDMPNGTTRYFYTKEEWDAYQRGEDGKKQDEFKKQQAQKKVAEDRNKMSGYNDWKKEQSAKKQQEETVSKNKAADEAQARKNQQNSTIIKKQQAENYKKNEEAAKHEGDRWNKVKDSLNEALKNAPKDIKDAPEPEQKPEVVNKVENEVNKEVQQETRNVEEEATNYAVNVINNIVEDDTVQAYFNNACWHNVFGDSEGQMKEWNQVYDTEIAPKIEATLTEAYNLYGPEYAAMLDQQIANLFQQMASEYTTAYLSQRMALYGY